LEKGQRAWACGEGCVEGSVRGLGGAGSGAAVQEGVEIPEEPPHARPSERADLDQLAPVIGAMRHIVDEVFLLETFQRFTERRETKLTELKQRDPQLHSKVMSYQEQVAERFYAEATDGGEQSLVSRLKRDGFEQFYPRLISGCYGNLSRW